MFRLGNGKRRRLPTPLSGWEEEGESEGGEGSPAKVVCRKEEDSWR